MKLTMTVTSYDSNSNTTATKSLGNINRNYVSYQGAGEAMNILPFNGSTQFTSFPQWVQQAGAALVSLTNRTYRDSGFVATWGVTEELNA